VPDAVQDTAPAPTPAPAAAPAASAAPPAVHAVATEPAHAATPGAEAGHAEHAGGHAGHHFNFDALNASHNQPYPAIEWVHGHPVLLLNAAEYAQVNYARLSEAKEFAEAKADPAYITWASQVANGASYRGVPAQELAKAMTVARDEAYLGSLPQALSFFNHQTFWSTIALTLTALVLLVFCRRKPEQVKPANRMQHMIEALVLFVRDDIVRPNIHHHPDAWVPYFASMFFALTACNLFGLIPLFGTATGNIGVTVALAMTTAVLMLFMGIKENGPVMFWVKLVPIKWSWHPGNMLLWIFLAFSEILQLVIRPSVLAIRLFANMLAGHSVLLVFATLGFIIFASDPTALGMSTTMGAFGWFLTIPFYALELLVALLQAYIFTLLSAVFIGLCAHPEH
jgi:ATP synthase subunit 6